MSAKTAFLEGYTLFYEDMPLTMNNKAIKSSKWTDRKIKKLEKELNG